MKTTGYIQHQDSGLAEWTFEVPEGIYNADGVAIVVRSVCERQRAILRDIEFRKLDFLYAFSELLRELTFLTGMVLTAEREGMLLPFITKETGERLKAKETAMLYRQTASGIPRHKVYWLQEIVAAYTGAIGALVVSKDKGKSLRAAAEKYGALLTTGDHPDISSMFTERPIIGGRIAYSATEWIAQEAHKLRSPNPDMKWSAIANEMREALRKKKQEKLLTDPVQIDALKELDSRSGKKFGDYVRSCYKRRYSPDD